MSASPKRPLTTDERDALEMMRGVGFMVASWDKRFANNVLFPCLETGVIGEKSAPQLWRLFIKYRRQTGKYHGTSQRKAELLGIAEQLAAPDYRKEQAKKREQELVALAHHCAGGPVPKGLLGAFPPTTIEGVRRYKQLQAYQEQERLTSL